MRTVEYGFHFVLALAGMLLAGQSLGCQPPAGFVNPPRPEIAPLEDLLAHTEQMEIARELAVVMQAASRPLQEVIRPTNAMPGVSGTFNLTHENFGVVGSRRYVCLTDGSTVVEEVLHSDAQGDNRRFRYVVWNYTNAKFRDVDYAVGEFIYTQPAPDRTHVDWTYRFALKAGLGTGDETRFRESFLERDFAAWMRSVLEMKRSTATGQAQACALPPGFVNPPRPDIAPLEELLSHTEVKVIDQPLAAVMQSANRPLRIDATKDLAGVTGTFRLSNGPYGTVGARRLVCKTDGSTSVEEVLLTESNADGSRFRYVVWNQTGEKFRDVAYAVGEFVRTQPEAGKTLVNWTYRFALRNGLSSEEKARFQKVFLEREFALWMRTQLDRDPPKTEARP